MALSLGSIFYALGVDVRGMDAASARIQRFARNTSRGQQSANRFTEQLRNMESAAVLVAGPLSGVGARIRSLSAIVDRSTIAFAASVAGIVGAGFALYKLSQSSISAEKRLGQIRQRLEVVTGSTAIASLEFNKLVDLSNRTGQEFGSLSSSYSKFIAAAHGTNLEGQKSADIFEKVAVAAGHLRLSTDQSEGIFKALEQIMSKGQVQAEELRGQLGDRLPGAFRIAADALGVTTRELNKMLKAGEVASEEFLPKFATQLLKTFGIDKMQAVDNITASQNKLNTAWLLFSDRLDKALGISATFKDIIDATTSALNSLAVNMDDVVRITQIATGAMLGFIAPNIIFGIGTLIALVVRLTRSIKALNIVMLANPAGGLASLLVRLTLALGGAYAATQLFDKAISSIDMDPNIQAIDAYIAQEDLMRRSLVDTTKTFVTEIEKQMKASELRLQQLKDDLVEAQKAQEAFQAANPKTVGWLEYFGLSGGNIDTSDIEAEIDAVTNSLTALQNRWVTLQSIMQGQELAPEIDTGGGTDSTASQLRRLERTRLEFEKLNAEVAAMSKGPIAMREFNREFDKREAILSYQQSLEQTGMAQGEINQKVAAFQRLWQQKIDLTPTLEGLRRIEDEFVQAFESIADTIASSMVEGKFAIEDFATVGKRFVEQLISTFIQLAVFNPLINSLLGTQNPTFNLGTSLGGAGGLGGTLASLFAGGFASGGVIGKSSVLSSGGNMYRVGERGAEAILPLTRNGSGQLGVNAAGLGGGGMAVTFDVNVINESKNTEVQTRRTDKGLDIRVIDKMVASAIGKRGSLTDQALQNRGRTVSRGV